MKKIPTLFKRIFTNHAVTGISPEVTPGLEWVLQGEGIATVKWDGACCAIIDGVYYKRYDAKHGKPVPVGAIKCEEVPDPVTGHLPCWVKCDRNNPGDRWFWAAYEKSRPTEDGTPRCKIKSRDFGIKWRDKLTEVPLESLETEII